jgi:hypothetical protein
MKKEHIMSFEFLPPHMREQMHSSPVDASDSDMYEIFIDNMYQNQIIVMDRPRIEKNIAEFEEFMTNYLADSIGNVRLNDDDNDGDSNDSNSSHAASHQSRSFTVIATIDINANTNSRNIMTLRHDIMTNLLRLMSQDNLQSLQDIPTPLTSSDLEKLTHVDFSIITKDMIGREIDKTCVICQSDFNENEKVCVLPCSGKHYFHDECINPWLNQLSKKCPTCRENIEDILGRKK